MASWLNVVVSTDSIASWHARGIALESLLSQYPHLVWTAFSTFGLSGPYRDFVGNNLIAEAMGGLMSSQGDDTKPPCVSPNQQGQQLAALHAAFATLLALWERRSSGRGQLVDVSVQDVIATIHFTLVRYTYGGEIVRRPGVRNPITSITVSVTS